MTALLVIGALGLVVGTVVAAAVSPRTPAPVLDERGRAVAGAAVAPMAGQLMDDAIVLTEHLRRRFGQKKIYIMGHSGGTFLDPAVVAVS